MFKQGNKETKVHTVSQSKHSVFSFVRSSTFVLSNPCMPPWISPTRPHNLPAPRPPFIPSSAPRDLLFITFLKVLPKITRNGLGFLRHAATSTIHMIKTPSLGVVAGCNIFMDCSLHNFFVRTPNLVFLGSLESLESIESRFGQKKKKL